MSTHRRITVVSLLSLLLVLVACSPADPVAVVDAARGEYTVELTSFFMRTPEVVELTVDTAEAVEGAVDEAAGEAAESDLADAADAMDEAAEMAEEMVEEVAGPQTAVLDVIVLFKGREALPGLTVEVTQAREGAEIGTWFHYLETGPMVSGGTRQMSIQLEDVAYQEGDGFSVSVPAATDERRAEFREYSEAG